MSIFNRNYNKKKIIKEEYIYRRSSKDVLELYDKEIYLRALEDPSVQPLKVGTYEINERGEKVLKLIT